MVDNYFNKVANKEPFEKINWNKKSSELYKLSGMARYESQLPSATPEEKEKLNLAAKLLLEASELLRF